MTVREDEERGLGREASTALGLRLDCTCARTDETTARCAQIRLFAQLRGNLYRRFGCSSSFEASTRSTSIHRLQLPPGANSDFDRQMPL